MRTSSPSSLPSRRRLAVVALVLGGLAAPAAPAASAPAPADGWRVAPGPTGSAIVVQDHIELSGFDLATDSAGTAYLGWISSATVNVRNVHLCVLPAGATACSGGVLTAPLSAEAAATSSGLRVVTTGPGAATLIWFHDTAASQTGPSGGKLATATYAGGVLSAAADQADAPSHGALLDVAEGPGESLWVVLSKGAATPEDFAKVQVRQGLSGTPDDRTAPWPVDDAWLAFAGSTPVLAVSRYGSISEPIRYASSPGGTWTSFAPVANTWNVGGAGLVSTTRGVRLVASEGNAGYRPVVSLFANGRFGTPRLIGDGSTCATTSHDLVTDASGRVADVGNECGRITVANLPATTKAALARFAAGDTVAGGPPQITTTGRGAGWVAFGTLSSSATKLKVVPVMLPALTTTKGRTGAAGKVTVRGPVSCLPAVQTPVGVSAKPASGWKVKATTLKLDGTALTGRALNGAPLAPGSTHTLVGLAKFSRPGHSTATVKASLTFRSCPTG
jgi:hypothetical protein